MALTLTQLKQVIKEELTRVLEEESKTVNCIFILHAKLAIN